MKILVINAGSSSIKYQLIDMENQKLLAKGICQRIGCEGSELDHKVGGQKYEIVQPMKNHSEGLKLILEALLDKEHGVISSISEINGFGHRYVNGGDKFLDPILANEEVVKQLKENIDFAPLHDPAHIMGIEACMKIAPSVPNVIVFDTGFYKNMPKKAKLYPVKYEFYEKYAVQKFGAHGISHDFLSSEVAKVMGKDRKDLRLITCHIGSGASISAIDHGTCVDTSMGFTPLEGIMMGTRCGDIDPSVVPYIMKKTGITADQVINIFNKESGLLGISGISNDIRDVEANENTNERAKLAMDMFIYRIKKYIGAYSAVMGGVDAIVFSAGVGENDVEVRESVINGLEYLGIEFDSEANKNFKRGEIVKISKDSSKVAIYIIPTDEEMMIAKATMKFVK